ncbi:hypothetical protein TNCV_3439801 [Trichonephila clavipes]|nr:hypothetical protein TNCV_3439801 [Trichonephila clavipes]
MSVQRFLKLREAFELFNSLDSDESDIEIAASPAIISVLPGTSELTHEEGDDNEVNTIETIMEDVPGLLEVRCGVSFHSLNHSKALGFRQQRAEKKVKDINHYG